MMIIIIQFVDQYKSIKNNTLLPPHQKIHHYSFITTPTIYPIQCISYFDSPFFQSHIQWKSLNQQQYGSGQCLFYQIGGAVLQLKFLLSMGVSVSQSNAEKQRAELLKIKKAKANTNSQIKSDSIKPIDINGEGEQIQGVTNVRANKNNLHQQKPKQSDEGRHKKSSSTLKLKSLKIEINKQDQQHPNAMNKSSSKNKIQQKPQFQTIDYEQIRSSKLNRNESLKKSIKNVSPVHEQKKVSFAQTQNKSAVKDQQNKAILQSNISKQSKVKVDNEPVINHAKASIYNKHTKEKVGIQKNSPVNNSPKIKPRQSTSKQKNKSKDKINDDDDFVFNEHNQQQYHQRMAHNGSKTLTVKKTPLKSQIEIQGAGNIDIQFQKFDWKIPKSTVNKVVPSYKKLKPEASVVLINKMGQPEQTTNEQPLKKSNWKSRRELMNEIVSGRLETTEASFSLNQCMPNIKDSDIYNKACV